MTLMVNQATIATIGLIALSHTNMDADHCTCCSCCSSLAFSPSHWRNCLSNACRWKCENGPSKAVCCCLFWNRLESVVLEFKDLPSEGFGLNNLKLKLAYGIKTNRKKQTITTTTTQCWPVRCCTWPCWRLAASELRRPCWCSWRAFPIGRTAQGLSANFSSEAWFKFNNQVKLSQYFSQTFLTVLQNLCRFFKGSASHVIPP